MAKQFKSVSVMLFLLAMSAGPAVATTGNTVANIPVVQQSETCTGVVKDATGETVIGASVVVKGTTNGTITDFDGNFSLSNVKKGDIIEISFVGYATQEIKWDGNPISVTLKEDTEMLEEVVVTGYGGKQLRTKVTNSISKVSEETFSIGVHSNPAQALSGAVSGLRVVQNSGNPGSTPTLTLRGGTNLDGSGSPLIMVDGQLRDSMSDINPEDIESMEVLKDAGATAIYGARASNGVILITTKSGKSGKAEVSLKAKFGLNYVNSPHEFLNVEEYLYWMRNAYKNSVGLGWSIPTGNLTSASPFGTGNDITNPGCQWNVMGYNSKWDYLLNDHGWRKMEDPINPGEYIIYKETDIKDYNFVNPSTTQDYNVNITGGNDNGTYYAGLGYNKSEGLPVTSYYERYSFVFNGSYKVNKWLKSTSNFNFNRANWDSMPGRSAVSEENYFGRFLSIPGTIRLEDEEGNMLLGLGADDANHRFQPEAWWEDNQSDKFTMIQSFDLQILKNLSLKLTGNWYYSESLNESFQHDYQANQAGTSWNRDRTSIAKFVRDFRQTYNAVLNYNTTFGKDHSLDAMLGMEYYDKNYKMIYAEGKGAPTDDFADLGYTSTDEGARKIDSEHYKNRILSYFGRVNYDYKGKYLFSGVFRYDGYSSLLDNRWGFFPGVSAGWIFGKEDFVKDAIPALSFGKLRASFGMNGNASGIGAYDLQGSYGSTKYNGSVGFLIGSLPNPSLKWERTRTFEVGTDLSFFDNRLNANLTYYNRLTMDKYAAFSLPSTTGFSSIQNNNGEFRNQGVEIELSGTILETNGFKWSAKGNITYNKNKVVKLPNNGNERNRQNGQQVYSGKGDELIWVGGYQEGQEPGVVVGYVAEGIFKTNEEINAAYPKGKVTSGNYNGKTQYTPAMWETLTTAEKNNGILLSPGDVKWKDVNKDGMIDKYDQEVLGNSMPHWTGGLNTTLTWKGLTLYVATDFALGFTNYDTTTPWYLGCMQGTFNTSTEVYDTWTPENVNAKYPKYVYADQLGAANYYRNSTLFAYNGSYLALREVALSYSLPKNIAEKLLCKRVDLSVTGQNLGYLCHAPVATPEKSRTGGTASGTGYPMPRTLLFGINVTF